MLLLFKWSLSDAYISKILIESIFPLSMFSEKEDCPLYPILERTVIHTSKSLPIPGLDSATSRRTTKESPNCDPQFMRLLFLNPHWRFRGAFAQLWRASPLVLCRRCDVSRSRSAGSSIWTAAAAAARRASPIGRHHHQRPKPGQQHRRPAGRRNETMEGSAL